MKLKKNIILRIADVLLAKGEHENSITFLDSVYNIYQIQEIKNKLVEAHLFSGNPYTALSIINETFSLITPLSSSFNDLMEIRDIINNYHTNLVDLDKNAFKQFLKAEYLLKQRKISEASQLLNNTIDKYSTLKIIPLISLRRAILLVKMKKFDQALNQILSIENSLLSDKSIIMAGQIYEQIYNDNEKAMEYYMRIINNYTNSIYFEPVRYHIRMLNNS